MISIVLQMIFFVYLSLVLAVNFSNSDLVSKVPFLLIGKLESSFIIRDTITSQYLGSFTSMTNVSTVNFTMAFNT